MPPVSRLLDQPFQSLRPRRRRTLHLADRRRRRTPCSGWRRAAM